MKMSKAKQQAIDFLAQLSQLGWILHNVTDSVVTIKKRIRQGNLEDFRQADMEYYYILSMTPHKGGSIWGTDGGGIGAMSAINNGVFTMNKSGNGGKRFAAELLKLSRNCLVDKMGT
jgi:hypothetical protein